MISSFWAFQSDAEEVTISAYNSTGEAMHFRIYDRDGKWGENDLDKIHNTATRPVFLRFFSCSSAIRKLLFAPSTP